MSGVRWSVVIPAYNEARRLPPHLDRIVSHFDGQGESYEVLVVDDGSTDATAAAVDAVARRSPAVRVLRGSRNEGKGAAVRRGMLAARGERRLFTDADGATPIVELKRLEPHLAGADIVIGSRALDDPSVMIAARRHRVAAGRIFHWAVSRLGICGIRDTQCGFKLFSRPAAEDLFPLVRTRGYAFDVELLLLAARRGWRIAEVAVNWSDQPGSKVEMWRDGARMLTQVMWASVVVRSRYCRRPGPP